MPTANWKTRKIARIKQHVSHILEELGYDLKDPNIVDTPKRVSNLWFAELYKEQMPKEKLFTVFPESHKQMICLTNHLSWSRCPHHLERVKLIVSVAYIPNDFVLGISKLARISNYYAQGLVLQEAFTENFADGLFEALKAKGVGVHVVGEHHCMCARGVKSNGKTVTTALRGVFLDEDRTREEFFWNIQSAKGV